MERDPASVLDVADRFVYFSCRHLVRIVRPQEVNWRTFGIFLIRLPAFHRYRTECGRGCRRDARTVPLESAVQTLTDGPKIGAMANQTGTFSGTMKALIDHFRQKNWMLRPEMRQERLFVGT